MISEQQLREAMRRAFNLGQTYWQQADSESYAQNRRADETARKFSALVDETAAMLVAATPTQPTKEGESRHG